MPTSSVAGFVLWLGARGGAEASHGDSHVPWRAAVGKRVRLVCFARFRGRWSVAGVARRMGKVAIDCLAARPTIYSPFVRFVKHYSSLYVRLYFQPAQPWKPTFRTDASALPGRYTCEDTSWRKLHWQKSAF